MQLSNQPYYANCGLKTILAKIILFKISGWSKSACTEIYKLYPWFAWEFKIIIKKNRKPRKSLNQHKFGGFNQRWLKNFNIGEVYSWGGVGKGSGLSWAALTHHAYFFTTAPHSSTLAWKIPWTEEPGRLQTMGSQRIGHNWATSLSYIYLEWFGTHVGIWEVIALIPPWLSLRFMVRNWRVSLVPPVCTVV